MAGLAIISILFVVADSILRGAFVQTVGRVTLILAMLACSLRNPEQTTAVMHALRELIP